MNAAGCCPCHTRVHFVTSWPVTRSHHHRPCRSRAGPSCMDTTLVIWLLCQTNTASDCPSRTAACRQPQRQMLTRAIVTPRHMVALIATGCLDLLLAATFYRISGACEAAPPVSTRGVRSAAALQCEQPPRRADGPLIAGGHAEQAFVAGYTGHGPALSPADSKNNRKVCAATAEAQQMQHGWRLHLP
jgi:hypothetical protein